MRALSAALALSGAAAQQCTSIPGQDCYHDDIRAVQNVDEAGCCAACATEPNCTHGLLTPDLYLPTGKCWLKFACSEPRSDPQRVTIVPGFGTTSSTTTLPTSLATAVFSLDLDGQATAFPHHWEECVGSGHAALTARSDWRSHLTRARKELGIKRTRFHGMLMDDFGISLAEDATNFDSLDSLMDFHISLDMLPLFELSFMPKWLAENPDQTTMYYKGIVSPPRDYSKWGKLVGDLAQHLLDRYGAGVAQQLMFEVWNEPNGGFWTGEPKQATYFQLYKEAADAIEKVSPSMQVGGPSTAGPQWLKELRDFAKNTSTKLDFISYHGYGGGNQKDDVGHVEDIIDTFEAGHRNAGGLPVVVTEWSSSWMYTIPFHDEVGSAPFILSVMDGVDGLTWGTSYWTFSDVFEEGGLIPNPFHGGFGLLTVNGTAKPAYRAFELLHGAGKERLPVESDSSCGEHSGLLATRSEGLARLFLFNAFTSGERGFACNATLHVTGATLAEARLARIDEDHANPLKAHQAMGSPEYPTQEQTEELEEASRVVWGALADDARAGALGPATLFIEVPPHGLAVLDVPRQKTVQV